MYSRASSTHAGNDLLAPGVARGLTSGPDQRCGRGNGGRRAQGRIRRRRDRRRAGGHHHRRPAEGRRARCRGLRAHALSALRDRREPAAQLQRRARGGQVLRAGGGPGLSSQERRGVPALRASLRVRFLRAVHRGGLGVDVAGAPGRLRHGPRRRGSRAGGADLLRARSRASRSRSRAPAGSRGPAGRSAATRPRWSASSAMDTAWWATPASSSIRCSSRASPWPCSRPAAPHP